MKINMKKFFYTLILLMIISCSSRVSKKEKDLMSYNDFKSELSLKYLQYADLLDEREQTKDSRYFRSKSELALKRKYKQLLSTEVNRNILFSEKDRFELLDYKKRLLKLVEENNITSVYPIKTANLFFFLDCWSYYKLKVSDANQAVYCEKNFLVPFLALEREFNEEAYVFYKQKSAEIGLTTEEKEYFDKFNNQNVVNIYFDLNSYKLNNLALKELKAFLKYLSTVMEDYKIVITGHTDRSGNVFYNNQLSRKRARTVENVLVKNGVNKDLISINNTGSKNPSVITKNQDLNKLNRRVEIRIERNFNIKQDNLPQPL